MMWKPKTQSYKDTLNYIKHRQLGNITSFKTPWSKLNKITINGLEWGSTNIIAARPGCFKTTFKDQLINEGIELNCTQEEIKALEFPFRILDFSFEMPSIASTIREFSSVINKTYQDICSANEDNPLTDEEIQKCYEYAKLRNKYPIDIIDETVTLKQFEAIIEKYIETYQKKTLISIDHSILFKKNHYGEDVNSMLYEFGEICTKLRRKYPIIFLIVSQLNRSIESSERNKEGEYGNFPTMSDLFGADALNMHAENIFILDRPLQRKLTIYGKARYVITNDILALHAVKTRNTDNVTFFLQPDVIRMRLNEIDAPPCQIKTKI